MIKKIGNYIEPTWSLKRNIKDCCVTTKTMTMIKKLNKRISKLWASFLSCYFSVVGEIKDALWLRGITSVSFFTGSYLKWNTSWIAIIYLEDELFASCFLFVTFCSLLYTFTRCSLLFMRYSLVYARWPSLSPVAYYFSLVVCWPLFVCCPLLSAYCLLNPENFVS